MTSDPTTPNPDRTKPDMSLDAEIKSWKTERGRWAWPGLSRLADALIEERELLGVSAGSNNPTAETLELAADAAEAYLSVADDDEDIQAGTHAAILSLLNTKGKQ